MSVNSQRYTLGPAKGLDQRFKGDTATAQTAQDLAWDARGGWRTAGGYRRILLGQLNQGQYVNPFAGSGTIWSLHRFAQGNGARQWLLFEADDGTSGPKTATMYYLDPSLRTSTPYTALVDRSGATMSGRTIIETPWQRTQSVTWGNRIYLFNGIDTPLVFDGTMADRAGFDGPPGAPTVMPIANVVATYVGAGNGPIAQMGVGPLPAATTDPPYVHQRRYVVTFVNSRGQESPPSAPSATVELKTVNTTTLTMGRGFHWLELPIGGDHVVARRIYCTENIVDSAGNTVLGRADVFFYLMDIEDNDQRGIEIFQDDDALASQLDPLTLGAWPTNAKLGVDFKGTMFVAGTDASEVVYSRAGFPEVFPPQNRIPIGDASLGPVTGLYATRNAVVVLKARGVYLIKGDPVSGFYSQTLDPSHGGMAPRTMIEIPNVGLAWAGMDGIYFLEGSLENEGVLTRVRNLGLPLYEDVRQWNMSAMLNAVAVHNPLDNEVMFHIPTMGSINPNHCLVFSYEIGQWTTRPNLPVSCALNTSDHRAYVYFGSWDSNHPGIHVYTRGMPDRDGVAIAPVYETVDLDFGAIFRSGAITGVYVLCVGFGNNDLTLDYKTARRLTYVRAAESENPQAEDQQYPESQNRMKVYGAAEGDYLAPDGTNEVAIWDTDTWGLWRPIVVRFDVSVQNVNPMHEFAAKLLPGNSATLFEIISIDFEIAGGELLKAKPFTTHIGSLT